MIPPTASDVLSLLVGALGKSVITEPEQLLVVQTDKSGQFSEGAPLCIVEAKSTEDVVAVVKIASETATPVVTRGGGSGLAGGAIGGPGEIVLSLAKMNRIKEISVDDRLGCFGVFGQ